MRDLRAGQVFRGHRRGERAAGVGEDAAASLTNLVFQLKDEGILDPKPRPVVPKKKKAPKPASAVARQPDAAPHKDFLGIAETTEILAEMYQSSFGGMGPEAGFYPQFAADGFDGQTAAGGVEAADAATRVGEQRTDGAGSPAAKRVSSSVRDGSHVAEVAPAGSPRKMLAAGTSDLRVSERASELEDTRKMLADVQRRQSRPEEKGQYQSSGQVQRKDSQEDRKEE